jgi:single-strand DNA-binding protein
MKNINQVILVGRLTAEPEEKDTAGGKKLARFSVATNYSWKNGEDEWQDGVDFHNVTAWSSLAEKVIEDFHKADLVFVKGKLRVNTWEDADGNARRTIEIVAFRVIHADSDEGKEAIADHVPAVKEE